MLHILTAYHQQSLGGLAPQLSQQGRKYDHYLISFSGKSARKAKHSFLRCLREVWLTSVKKYILIFNFLRFTLVGENLLKNQQVTWHMCEGIDFTPLQCLVAGLYIRSFSLSCKAISHFLVLDMKYDQILVGYSGNT